MHLEVFNLLGEKVCTLFSGRTDVGTGEVEWDGRSDAGTPLPAGVYFFRFRTETGYAQSRKVILIR